MNGEPDYQDDGNPYAPPLPDVIGEKSDQRIPLNSESDGCLFGLSLVLGFPALLMCVGGMINLVLGWNDFSDKLSVLFYSTTWVVFSIAYIVLFFRKKWADIAIVFITGIWFVQSAYSILACLWVTDIWYFVNATIYFVYCGYAAFIGLLSLHRVMKSRPRSGSLQ